MIKSQYIFFLLAYLGKNCFSFNIDATEDGNRVIYPPNVKRGQQLNNPIFFGYTFSIDHNLFGKR